MRSYIKYKLFVRKLYSKRVKGRAVAANNLTLILFLLNTASVILLLEAYVDMPGLAYLSLNLKMPLAPLAVVLVFVFYSVYKVFFPVKDNKEVVAIIRACHVSISTVKRRNVFLYLISSVFIFIFSLISLFFTS